MNDERAEVSWFAPSTSAAQAFDGVGRLVPRKDFGPERGGFDSPPLHHSFSGTAGDCSPNGAFHTQDG